MNPRVRQQILHKIQQIIPAVHGLGLIANHAYSAPYEDLKLRGK